VLSLPWAMEQSGLVVGILSLLFWAAAADFSIYILLMAARRAGDTTYEAVAVRAFGPSMEVVVGVQLVVLCWMATVGYIVLSGSMAHTVVRAVAAWSGAPLPSWLTPKLAMVAVTVGILPGSLRVHLSSLWATSLFSFFSILLLGGVVAIRSLTALTAVDAPPLRVNLWPESFEGVLYSLPVLSAAFVCHFNVLPMHAELASPTRTRMHAVLHAAIAMCLAVYLAIGVLGYLYTGHDTCDGIMANYCDTDVVATVGRVALVLTLTFNLPLLVLPCRHNLDRLIQRWGRPTAVEKEDAEEEDGSQAKNLPPVGADPPEVGTDDLVADDPRGRVIRTLLLLTSSCVAACAVPGVAVVWTLTGSTVSLAIGFVLPCAIYLKLRAARPWNVRLVAAALLLVLAAMASVACTVEAVRHVLAGHSAPCPAGYDPCRPRT